MMSSAAILKRFLPALLLVFVAHGNASEQYLDYLVRTPNLGEGAPKREFSAALTSIDGREYAAAQERMNTLFSLLDSADYDIDQASYGQLLANRGIVSALNGDLAQGLVWLNTGIEAVESVAGPFDVSLINMLIVVGLINFHLEEFTVAEEALRRAQHIAHRDGGVYTRKQLPIVDYLTDILAEQGYVFSADREQRFNLKISEQVYGADSEEIVPILEDLGHYFASRGGTLPSFTPVTVQNKSDAEAFTDQYRATLFRESIELYDRAIRIIEDTYGPNDLRLVEPLRGLARARLLQRSAHRYAEAAMERVVNIVSNNPGSDLADRAQAVVGLGDTYTLTSDSRASEKYLEAWHMLGEEEGHAELRNELFGTPTRLELKPMDSIPLTFHPYAAEQGVPLFADVEFDVVNTGRVTKVKVVDGNVPNEQRNLLRSYVRGARYRPRIVDGEIVPTEGLTMHQTYRVVKPAETSGISINIGTN